MGANVIAQIAGNMEEEMQEARRRERIRREGHEFIKVINRGNPNFNLIHDVHDMVLVDKVNPETGENVPVAQLGSAVLEFKMDPMTGDLVAWVLDDDFNRAFLARHLGYGLLIEDKEMAAHIKALVGKPFKVELSEEEELEKQRKEIDARLEKLRKKKEHLGKDGPIEVGDGEDAPHRIAKRKLESDVLNEENEEVRMKNEEIRT